MIFSLLERLQIALPGWRFEVSARTRGLHALGPASYVVKAECPHGCTLADSGFPTEAPDEALSLFLSRLWCSHYTRLECKTRLVCNGIPLKEHGQ